MAEREGARNAELVARPRAALNEGGDAARAALEESIAARGWAAGRRIDRAAG